MTILSVRYVIGLTPRPNLVKFKQEKIAATHEDHCS